MKNRTAAAIFFSKGNLLAQSRALRENLCAGVAGGGKRESCKKKSSTGRKERSFKFCRDFFYYLRGRLAGVTQIFHQRGVDDASAEKGEIHMGNKIHMNRKARRHLMATGKGEEVIKTAASGLLGCVQKPFRHNDRERIFKSLEAARQLGIIPSDSGEEEKAGDSADSAEEITEKDPEAGKKENIKEICEIKSGEISPAPKENNSRQESIDAENCGHQSICHQIAGANGNSGEVQDRQLISLLAPFSEIDCRNPIWDDEHLPSKVCRHIAEIRKGKLSERGWIIKNSESFKKIIEQYQKEFFWAGVEIPEISRLDGRKIDSDTIVTVENLLKNISVQKTALEALSLNQPATAAEWAQLSENLAKAEAGNQDDVEELRKAVEALPGKEPEGKAPELQNGQSAGQRRIRELEGALERAEEEHNREIEQKEARIHELEGEKEALEKTYNEVEVLHGREIAQLKEEIHELDDQCKKLKKENGGLKYQSKPPFPRNSLSEEDMDILRNYFSGGKKGLLLISLTQALDILRILYSDRVEIVEEAWKSAGESNFRDPTKAFFMMERLVNKFLDIIREGKGMGESKKQCFSDKEFSSGENDNVSDSLRTFSGILMREHLRIGNNQSSEKGWRCHFHYDPASRKIIIGHCGKHLNFK